MKSIPLERGVVFQPWDTYNGLRDLKWQDHYTAAGRFFSCPDIFECKDVGNREAFMGKETSNNSNYFAAFWEALGRRQRLPVRGSDAHKLSDYGMFPGGLTTWIKGEPTFRGLLQAIKEPSLRSWLGDIPPKMEQAGLHPDKFIKEFAATKTASSKLPEQWFDGVRLPVNPDLVAVIGNKGSGKSALADMIALVGNARGHLESYSFLSEKRFRDKKKNRGVDFEASLTWVNEIVDIRTLAESHDLSKVERVRYIPQAFFEKVCAGHSPDELRDFTDQIEQTIFAHIPSVDRKDSPNFREHLNLSTRETDLVIEDHRGKVRYLNRQVCEAKRLAAPSVRKTLEATRALRTQRVADLKAAPPTEPQGAPTRGTEDAALAALFEDQRLLSAERSENDAKLGEFRSRFQAAKRLQIAVDAIEQHVQSEQTRLAEDAEHAGVDLQDVVSLRVDATKLASIVKRLGDEETALREHMNGQAESSIASRQARVETEISSARSRLTAAQSQIQSDRDRHAKWLRDVAEAEAEVAATSKEIDRLEGAPAEIDALIARRNDAARKVAESLLEVRKIRDGLVKNARDSIDQRLSKLSGFSIEFINAIDVDLEASFFDVVKQVSGTFRGDEDGRRALDQIIQSRDRDSPESILALANEIERAITSEKRGDQAYEYDLETMLKKGHSPEDLLDLLFAFEWLKPRFTLAQNGQPLEQLSPGQRGAMLLVFYLLVEDSDLPIVLDQPEENLDNQTVYSLLVPAIKQAKERRQIIMVTHNANLAVCCDAEQVIHASFDRANGNKITYRAGAIEDPAINALVVDVLEGTKPAFDNRESKYLRR